MVSEMQKSFGSCLVQKDECSLDDHTVFVNVISNLKNTDNSFQNVLCLSILIKHNYAQRKTFQCKECYPETKILCGHFVYRTGRREVEQLFHSQVCVGSKYLQF